MRVISCFLLIFSFVSAANSSPTRLQKTASNMGFSRPIEVFQAIALASNAYGVNPNKLLAIAIVESGLNHKAINLNRNGTKDHGLFQINDVVKKGECSGFNVKQLVGNALCAAKMLRLHQKHAHKDPYWLGRYHSKTPSLKRSYYHKVVTVAKNGNFVIR
jgi:hypothetical protein